jgi:hypothetical protein
VDRVLDVLERLACTRVWVRGAGRHVLLGLYGQEAFARLTALGGGSYGLAFPGDRVGKSAGNPWELLLIDDLAAAVEHAVIGGDALPTSD